ncbi:MAG: TolC family protein [Prevotella sp.]|nr:TolC family protein [Prevotella sp.]
MNRLFGIILLAATTMPVGAQQVLSLDSCRALALRNNKQLGVAKVKQDVAGNLKKAARTKYLPKVNAMGGYMYTSREVSILSSEQKDKLSSMGSTVGAVIGQLGFELPMVADALNGVGQGIVDAFRTDTRNMFGGAVMVSQPLFAGGAITALNRMAEINLQMAGNDINTMQQATLYGTDQAYWTVVSLKQKKRLAEGFLSLVKKLDDDVQKMIREGVATRSEGLAVSVKVNEAEMAVMKVDNGLTLAKMLLCQICGLPSEAEITLADEDVENIAVMDIAEVEVDKEEMLHNRPELKTLQNIVDINNQNVNFVKSGNLPKVMLMGGYAVSNPNVYDGFHRSFAGVWNVGVLVSVPVWNWGDVAYKARAAKGLTTMARLELEEAQEKMELQVTQSSHKVKEARKRLQLAEANIKRADENLRCANLGFYEGVMSSTVVMEAQTAWLEAQSQKIDAEIDVRLSQVDLRKAMGTLE